MCSSQLKETYDASKKASNQQLFVRMLGSSITLSFISIRTSKVQLPCLKPRTNRDKKSENGRFDPLLTHALYVQRHVTPRQPIGMKRKRALSSTTAHELSFDTNFVRLLA